MLKKDLLVCYMISKSKSARSHEAALRGIAKMISPAVCKYCNVYIYEWVGEHVAMCEWAMGEGGTCRLYL